MEKENIGASKVQGSKLERLSLFPKRLPPTKSKRGIPKNTAALERGLIKKFEQEGLLDPRGRAKSVIKKLDQQQKKESLRGARPPLLRKGGLEGYVEEVPEGMENVPFPEIPEFPTSERSYNEYIGYAKNKEDYDTYGPFGMEGMLRWPDLMLNMSFDDDPSPMEHSNEARLDIEDLILESMQNAGFEEDTIAEFKEKWKILANGFFTYYAFTRAEPESIDAMSSFLASAIDGMQDFMTNICGIDPNDPLLNQKVQTEYSFANWGCFFGGEGFFSPTANVNFDAKEVYNSYYKESSGPDTDVAEYLDDIKEKSVEAHSLSLFKNLNVRKIPPSKNAKIVPKSQLSKTKYPFQEKMMLKPIAFENSFVFSSGPIKANDACTFFEDKIEAKRGRKGKEKLEVSKRTKRRESPLLEDPLLEDYRNTRGYMIARTRLEKLVDDGYNVIPTKEFMEIFKRNSHVDIEYIAEMERRSGLYSLAAGELKREHNDKVLEQYFGTEEDAAHRMLDEMLINAQSELNEIERTSSIGAKSDSEGYETELDYTFEDPGDVSYVTANDIREREAIDGLCSNNISKASMYDLSNKRYENGIVTMKQTNEYRKLYVWMVESIDGRDNSWKSHIVRNFATNMFNSFTLNAVNSALARTITLGDRTLKEYIKYAKEGKENAESVVEVAKIGQEKISEMAKRVKGNAEELRKQNDFFSKFTKANLLAKVKPDGRISAEEVFENVKFISRLKDLDMYQQIARWYDDAVMGEGLKGDEIMVYIKDHIIRYGEDALVSNGRNPKYQCFSTSNDIFQSYSSTVVANAYRYLSSGSDEYKSEDVVEVAKKIKEYDEKCGNYITSSVTLANAASIVLSGKTLSQLGETIESAARESAEFTDVTKKVLSKNAELSELMLIQSTVTNLQTLRVLSERPPSALLYTALSNAVSFIVPSFIGEYVGGQMSEGAKQTIVGYMLMILGFTSWLQGAPDLYSELNKMNLFPKEESTTGMFFDMVNYVGESRPVTWMLDYSFGRGILTFLKGARMAGGVVAFCVNTACICMGTWILSFLTKIPFINTQKKYVPKAREFYEGLGITSLVDVTKLPFKAIRKIIFWLADLRIARDMASERDEETIFADSEEDSFKMEELYKTKMKLEKAKIGFDNLSEEMKGIQEIRLNDKVIREINESTCWKRNDDFLNGTMRFLGSLIGQMSMVGQGTGFLIIGGHVVKSYCIAGLQLMGWSMVEWFVDSLFSTIYHLTPGYWANYLAGVVSDQIPDEVSFWIQSIWSVLLLIVTAGWVVKTVWNYSYLAELLTPGVVKILIIAIRKGLYYSFKSAQKLKDMVVGSMTQSIYRNGFSMNPFFWACSKEDPLENGCSNRVTKSLWNAMSPKYLKNYALFVGTAAVLLYLWNPFGVRSLIGETPSGSSLYTTDMNPTEEKSEELVAVDINTKKGTDNLSETFKLAYDASGLSEHRRKTITNYVANPERIKTEVNNVAEYINSVAFKSDIGVQLYSESTKKGLSQHDKSQLASLIFKTTTTTSAAVNPTYGEMVTAMFDSLGVTQKDMGIYFPSTPYEKEKMDRDIDNVAREYERLDQKAIGQ